MRNDEIQEKINSVRKDIRNFERKIKNAPPEVRNRFKSEIMKMRRRVRALQADLDAR